MYCIIIIVYTNNQWTPGDVLVDYDYTKVKEYQRILAKDQLQQQQSLTRNFQLIQGPPGLFKDHQVYLLTCYMQCYEYYNTVYM